MTSLPSRSSSPESLEAIEYISSSNEYSFADIEMSTTIKKVMASGTAAISTLGIIASNPETSYAITPDKLSTGLPTCVDSDSNQIEDTAVMTMTVLEQPANVADNISHIATVENFNTGEILFNDKAPLNERMLGSNENYTFTLQAQGMPADTGLKITQKVVETDEMGGTSTILSNTEIMQCEDNSTTIDPDTDGDGVKDSVDACPTVPGTLPNGCNPVVEPPKLDSDGDGILDENDACPTVAGNGPDGCPTPVVPPVTTTPVTPVVPPNLPAVPKVCAIPGAGLQLVTPKVAKKNGIFSTRVAMRNIGTANIDGKGTAANTRVVVKGAKLVGSKAQLKKQGIVAKGNTITIDVPNKGIAPGKALAKALKLRALKGKQVSIVARATRGGNALYSFQDCEMPAKTLPTTAVKTAKVKLK